MAKPRAETITRGSGNVFADLGFPDAEERQTKLSLAMAINDGVRDERWLQIGRALSGRPGQAMPVVGSAEQFAYGLRLMLHGIRAESS